MLAPSLIVYQSFIEAALMQVTSGEAAAAQEYLMKHGPRMRRMADVFSERQEKRLKRTGPQRFSCAWVHNHDVTVS